MTYFVAINHCYGSLSASQLTPFLNLGWHQIWERRKFAKKSCRSRSGDQGRAHKGLETDENWVEESSPPSLPSMASRQEPSSDWNCHQSVSVFVEPGRFILFIKFKPLVYTRRHHNMWHVLNQFKVKKVWPRRELYQHNCISKYTALTWTTYNMSAHTRKA